MKELETSINEQELRAEWYKKGWTECEAYYRGKEEEKKQKIASLLSQLGYYISDALTTKTALEHINSMHSPGERQ